MVEQIKNVILSMSTVHNIKKPLKESLGEDIKIYILSLQGIVSVNNDNMKDLAKEIVDSVNNIPEQKYYLLLAGMPYANVVAYTALTQRFGENVGVLIYDDVKKRYVLVDELSKTIDILMR